MFSLIITRHCVGRKLAHSAASDYWFAAWLSGYNVGSWLVDFP